MPKLVQQLRAAHLEREVLIPQRGGLALERRIARYREADKLRHLRAHLAVDALYLRAAAIDLVPPALLLGEVALLYVFKLRSGLCQKLPVIAHMRLPAFTFCRALRAAGQGQWACPALQRALPPMRAYGAGRLLQFLPECAVSFRTMSGEFYSYSPNLAYLCL